MTTEKEKIYTLDPEALITSFVNLDPSGAAKSMADLCFQRGKEAGKSEAITLIDNELRTLYFLVKKGHDERIEAQIKILEKLKGELAK